MIIANHLKTYYYAYILDKEWRDINMEMVRPKMCLVRHVMLWNVCLERVSAYTNEQMMQLKANEDFAGYEFHQFYLCIFILRYYLGASYNIWYISY